MMRAPMQCPICQSEQIFIDGGRHANRLECQMYCYTWQEPPTSWRDSPVSEQQAKWLAVRGLACEGTRGDAADMIGDRIPWRKEPPTDAQREWFEAKGLMLPATSGDCADMMWEWHWREQEAKQQ